MRWPVDKPNEHDVEVPLRAQQELKFNEGKSVGWSEGDGSVWQMFFFRWGPAKSLSERVLVQFAKSHRPEICLPAAGLELKLNRGIETFKVNGLELPFRAYFFKDRGLPLHVYYWP